MSSFASVLERIPRPGECHSPHSPEYQAWLNMRRRCYDPKQESFSYYGGRGITVCERWKNHYDSFLLDMGRKPSPKHSLDRIEGKKGYSPKNCRWATAKEQANNRRPRKRRKDTQKGALAHTVPTRRKQRRGLSSSKSLI
jgi:hypothetical protein